VDLISSVSVFTVPSVPSPESEAIKTTEPWRSESEYEQRWKLRDDILRLFLFAPVATGSGVPMVGTWGAIDGANQAFRRSCGKGSLVTGEHVSHTEAMSS
jgi:hypothetical protein